MEELRWRLVNMDTEFVKPGKMIKRLVGEYFECRVRLVNDFGYRVELYTDINRSPEVYPMDFDGTDYWLRLPLQKSGFFSWQIRYQREGTKTWRWIRETNGKRFVGIIQVDPEWLNQAIAYNVFVRFFGGRVATENVFPRPGEGGTFDDVKAHLDDLKRLGVSILYFNPIHLIGELYRKYNVLDQLPSYWQPGSPYSIKDYKSIDPELTYDRDTKKHLLSDPQQEFADLITAAHERNMLVIMDLVFNHTAHDFVFQRIRPEWYLYKENITSLEEPYLYPEDLKKGKPWGDAKHTVAPYDHGVWFEDAAQLNWEYMIPEASNKPPKNPSLNEMWEYFKSIPRYWIRHFGIDGFRCDVAYRVPPAFWKACIAEAREEAKMSRKSLSGDVVFIAEAYTDNLRELQEAGFSAVYGDFSNKLANKEDFCGYLKYMLNINSDEFPDGSKWFIFPESHDFARTPEKIVGGDSTDLNLSFLANKTRWFMTVTSPGIPLIFNGFEKVELKPVNLFSYGAVDWERQTDLRRFMEAVNKLRVERPSLWLTASFKELECNKNSVAAYLRQKGEETSVMVVNLDVYNDIDSVEVILPESFGGVYRLRDLLGESVELVKSNKLAIKLVAGDCRLYGVQKLA